MLLKNMWSTEGRWGICLGGIIIWGMKVDYFFFGTGSCLGGSLMNDFKSWWITSDRGLSCSSLNSSRKVLISSVVLKAINSDFFSLITLTMLNNNYLFNYIISVKFC